MTTDAPRRNATIRDVARAAGVSTATVSRVMNDLATVDPGIADRVREAVHELAYVPSGLARSLSLGVTKTIAMVVPDLGNPMFQEILAGFNRVAAEAGYRVLVGDSREDPVEELELAREMRKRTDALVLCAPRSESSALAHALGELGPAVVVNRPGHETGGAPVVRVDYEQGIRSLAAHLVGLGHRRILYLEGPATSPSNLARLAGLRALEAETDGLRVMAVPCGSSMDDGYRAFDDVRGSGATAVMAFSDVVALGLLGRLHDERVSVPGQLSVTGFDDIPMARFCAPPLTTMAVPQSTIGVVAWEQLSALLTGVPPREATTFTPSLVVRASTGAP